MKASEFCTSLISERIGGEKMTYVKPTIQTLGFNNINLNKMMEFTGNWSYILLPNIVIVQTYAITLTLYSYE